MSIDALATTRQILDGLFDPAVLVESDLRPFAFNDAFVQLIGLSRRRLEKRLGEGARLLDLVRCEGAALDERIGAIFENASPVPVRLAEIPLQVGDASYTTWIALVPVLDAGGRVIAVSCVFRDVTAEARMQRHFRQLLAESEARAEDLERKVQERTAELQQVLSEVTRLARTDPLTGVLNRRAFSEYAEHALALARRTSRQVGVLLCDLDYFKKLNDGFGHAAGDAMLVAVARALGERVRSTDRVARFGGEEFVVLLTETTLESVLAVGDRCCRAVRDLPFAELVPGKETPQTVSIGVAVFPRDADDLDGLLRRADEALYRAKEAGRDRVVLVEPT